MRAATLVASAMHSAMRLCDAVADIRIHGEACRAADDWDAVTVVVGIV
jgi:hypothetical protein